MKTKLILGATFVVLVGALFLGFINKQAFSDPTPTPDTSATQVATAPTQNTPTPASNAPQNTGTSDTPKPSGYTMAQVQAHNSASSCWTAINGSVYDVTGWINRHPGGAQAILSLCGTDGSAAFNGQHGGQRRPESELASFRIGALAL